MRNVIPQFTADIKVQCIAWIAELLALTVKRLLLQSLACVDTMKSPLLIVLVRVLWILEEQNLQNEPLSIFKRDLLE